MNAFNWDQLIDVAEHLVEVAEDASNKATKEAYYRSAVNRSYYAAYKSSEDWLVMNGVAYSPADSGDSHGAMINRLVEAMAVINKPNSDAVRSLMLSLRSQRKFADYKVTQSSQPWDKERAERLIESSRRVHKKLINTI